MGMSASQARLIALTARMSDVEYEGQQINQQRLNLANQVAALNEQFYNMDVPTPPSYVDYMDTVYTGTSSNGNVEVTPGSKDGEAGFWIGTETTGPTLQYTEATAGNVAQSSASVKLADAGIVKSSDSLNKVADGQKADAYVASSATDFTNCPNPASYYEVTIYDEDHLASTRLDPSFEAVTKEVEDENGEKHDEIIGYKGTLKSDTPASSFEEGKKYSGPNGVIVEGSTLKANYDNFANKKYMVADGDSYKDYSGSIPPQEGTLYESIDPDAYAKLKEGKDKFTGIASEKTADAIDASEISNLYYIENGVAKKADESLFEIVDGKATLKDTSLQIMKLDATNGQDFNTDKGIITVGGNKAYLSIDDAKADYDSWDASKQTAFENCVKAIQNYCGGEEQEAEIAKYAIIDKGSSFGVTLVSDIKDDLNGAKGDGRAIQINVDMNGTFMKKDFASLDKVTLNQQGEPVSTTATGTPVTLKQSTVENKAKHAMLLSQYEAKKADYDRQQEEFNKQTSYYHLEDKKLELKLKRLDTERNALNTEMDAVKKVIQDSIDKGFKTFSG